LYDPDRSTALLQNGAIQPWPRFVAAAQQLRRRFEASAGAGLHLLTGHVTSPTLIAQINELLTRMPGARWHRYETGLRDAADASSRLVFGRPLDSYFQFDRADVVVSLDADIFDGQPQSVRYARAFAERRRVRAGAATMNRLYAVGGAPTLTGASADERLPLRAHDVELFARALASALGVAGIDAPTSLPTECAGVDVRRFLAAVAADLRAHSGRSIVAAGEFQPPAVHAIAHAVNHALGNAGETLPRGVERSARVRRYREHCPAAHRSAL
jgi:molybdopterin-containing oxidoreductase family iron-sulfur binding subunit